MVDLTQFIDLKENNRALASAVIKQAIADKDFEFFNSEMFDFYKCFLSYGDKIQSHYQKTNNQKKIKSPQEKAKEDGYINLLSVCRKLGVPGLKIRGICHKLKLPVIPIKNNTNTTYKIKRKDISKIVIELLKETKK